MLLSHVFVKYITLCGFYVDECLYTFVCTVCNVYVMYVLMGSDHT